MDKYISNVNISLLLPVASIFVLLTLHCYLYRGMRLALTFFGSILLYLFGRKMAFHFAQESTGRLPYLILGTTPQVFQLPLLEYMGWAITFYLSWYLAERILKRIGLFSDRIFPTIVWSILMAGAISYCVEATATRAGWWLWMFPDFRFKDFLLAPFVAIQAWSAFAASLLLIFFLSECSRFRKEWWKVFLYFAILGFIITTIVYYIALSAPKNISVFYRVFNSVSILLPVVLMFFYPVYFKYERHDNKNSKTELFLYDVIPLFALLFILSTCIVIDIAILNKPLLLFSALPLIFLLIFSIRKIPITLIFLLALILLLIGNKFVYIIFIPTAIFFAFWVFGRLRERYKLKLTGY